MRRSWLTNLFRKWGRQPARPARFTPRVHPLEDRAVPATFYVDPNAVPVGGNATFDAGRPTEHTGPFKGGADGSVYDNISDAIADANTNPGTDTILLAFVTDNIFEVTATGPDSPVQITDSVNIVGSGPGASVLQTDHLNDQPTAVLEVTGAGVAANLSNLTLYGGAAGFDAGGNVAAPGSVTGQFIRYDAGTSGMISNAVVTGIFNNAHKGIGIGAVGTGTNVTVQNTTFANIGAVGVAASGGANVNLFGNTYTGKGAGDFTDAFAQITDGATATISGNTVSNNQGITLAGGEESAAIIITDTAAGGGAGTPVTNVSIFGNQLSGNFNGVFIGSGATDTSTADIQFNNLNDDAFGVQTNRNPATNVNAPNNYWGGAGGPFVPATGTGGTGSNVGNDPSVVTPAVNDVTFAPFRTTPATVATAPFATTVPAYLTQITQVSVQAGADAAEGGAAGTFTLTRPAGSDTASALTVNISLTGTATNGTDYTAVPTTVTFAAGSTTATVTITPIDDNLVEGTETVILTVQPGTGYTPTGGPATITIGDNDVALPAVGVAAAGDATEPATAGHFTITRSGDTSGALTVTYALTGTAVEGTDYAITPTPTGTVTFAAGSATATIDVAPISRPGFQGTRTVTLTINPSPATYTVTADTATINVLDDTPAPAAVGVSATGDATQGGTAGTFTITRSGDTSGALTVNYTLGGTGVEGTDYTITPTPTGTVTFAAGQPTATVTVTAPDQPGFQGNKTVTLNITPNAAYTVTAGSATLNVLDNTAAPATVSVTVLSNASQPPVTPGTFQLTRSGDTSAALTVNYTVGGTAVAGTDYTALPGSVTFAAGSATADVTVTPIATTTPGATKTITLTVTPDSSITVGSGSAQMTLTNNNVATVVSITGVADASEPSTAGTFQVTRTGDTSQDLTVSYSIGGTATNGVDYQTLPGTVTIPAGQTSATITVTPIDNATFQGTRTISLTLQPGAGFTVGTGTAQISLLDNENPPPVRPDVTVTQTADASEPSTPGNFRFTRTGDTSAPLTVSFTTSGSAISGVDYTALPGSVTFAAGQSTVDVPVTPLGATFTTGTRTVVVTLTAGPDFTTSASTATVTINAAPVPPITTTPVVVSGPADGTVLVFDPDSSTGKLPTSGTAIGLFSGFPGSIRTATGDVNGDGFLDTIMVTGPGAPARFAVVSGKDNTTTLVPPTDPFGSNFTGGAFVAAGDFNKDGRAEIVITPDQLGGPNVVIFTVNANGTLGTPKSFFALGNPSFRGGARPAVGDVNGDGVPDLAVGAGFLGGPVVEIHNGKAIATGDSTTLIGSGFFAFPGSDSVTLRNGVFLAIGDVNGDGFGDLIAGGGPGGGPRVLILDGKLLSANNVNGAYSAPVGNFFYGDPNSRGGVRVSAAEVNGDKNADVVVGSGEGLPATARVIFGSSIKPSGDPTSFQDLSVFGNQILTGGVFVG